MNYLELLPPPVMGHVFKQLVARELFIMKNGKPLVMHTSSRLSRANKKLASIVNDSDVIEPFLAAMKKAYGNSDLHHASILNTVGARKWIWKHIKLEGYDQDYQTIHELFPSNLTIYEGFTFYEISPACPIPSESQTKQGFELYFNKNSCHIATPFGKILFCRKTAFKIFKAEFQGMFTENKYRQGQIAECYGKGPIYIIEGNGSEIQISEQEAKSKIGTNQLIVNKSPDYLSIYSRYKIKTINELRTPDVVLHDSPSSMLTDNSVYSMWKMLQVNSSGLDPVTNTIRHPIAIHEPLFNNISNASDWGIDLAAKLDQQPLADKPWMKNKNKLLTLDNYDHALAFELLNNAAIQFLEKDTNWVVYPFGAGLNTRVGFGKGLELWIDDKRSLSDLSTLKQAYASVIQSICQNWTQQIVAAEPDYYLFEKKSELPQEIELIQALVQLLGLSHSVSCGSKRERGFLRTLLWIKKEGFQDSLKALNINPS